MNNSIYLLLKLEVNGGGRGGGGSCGCGRRENIIKILPCAPLQAG